MSNQQEPDNEVKPENDHLRTEADKADELRFDDSDDRKTEPIAAAPIDAKPTEAASAPATAKPTTDRPKSRRGFAAMDPALVREIASKGGKAAHLAGTAHEFNSEEARQAGRKGGQAAHRHHAIHR